MEARSDVRLERVGAVTGRLLLGCEKALDRPIRCGGVFGRVLGDREARQRFGVPRGIADDGERGEPERSRGFGIPAEREGLPAFVHLLPGVVRLRSGDTGGEQPRQPEAGHDGGTAPA